MKKIYETPYTEAVNLKLTGSVLEGNTTPVITSPVADPRDSFGKENNFLFEDEGDFGDIWGSEDEDPNDLWGDN